MTNIDAVYAILVEYCVRVFKVVKLGSLFNQIRFQIFIKSGSLFRGEKQLAESGVQESEEHLILKYFKIIHFCRHENQSTISVLSKHSIVSVLRSAVLI